LPIYAACGYTTLIRPTGTFSRQPGEGKEFFPAAVVVAGGSKKWNPLRLMAWLKQAGSSKDGKLSHSGEALGPVQKHN
jgi:hypothetical protein